MERPTNLVDIAKLAHTEAKREHDANPYRDAAHMRAVLEVIAEELGQIVNRQQLAQLIVERLAAVRRGGVAA